MSVKVWVCLALLPVDNKIESMSEDRETIKATSDLFIAILLSAPKNEPILRGVINAVLENSGHVPIKTATVLNPFNVKEYPFNKQIVLDVRVQDELDRVFNIEIQTTPHRSFVERIVFGWAETFSGQLHAGHQYHELKPVFCIVITEFKLFDDDSVHLIFELRERNRPEVVLTRHLQMHFLQLQGVLRGRREVLEGVSPSLRRWLNFMSFGGLKGEQEMSLLVDNDPLVMQAVAELQRFSSDPDMRELERRRKLWKLEYYSGLTAAKAEGKAEGAAEGEARGTVLTFLRARFKNVPKDIEVAVRAMTDLTALESLAVHAETCESLDEFSEALK